MSNNKQSMKLYTEEQVREIIERAELNQHLTPIELPSDEEIEEISNSIDKYHIVKDFYCDGFKDGAKLMRDKIQGGNK